MSVPWRGHEVADGDVGRDSREHLEMIGRQRAIDRPMMPTPADLTQAPSRQGHHPLNRTPPNYLTGVTPAAAAIRK